MTSNIRGHYAEGNAGESKTETIHGVLVNISRAGVLIVGEPGIGKSRFALEMVSKGHALVADDVVIVKRSNRRLIGYGPVRFAGILAIRGSSFIDVRDLFGRSSYCESTFIDFCIELRDDDRASVNDRRSRGSSELDALGVRIPKLIMRRKPLRNLPFSSESDRLGDDTVTKRVISEHDKLVSSVSV